ncbi:MAG: hypothetical protein JNL70_08805 [Saprospiraceae bacterium]|nr:hypothetical protein [Saprospiraceae bacterium]
MNEYILTVSDIEKADLLNLLKNFTTVRLRRIVEEPIPPEVEAFVESTIEGLKQVELHEKGLIQLKNARQAIKELEEELNA